MICPKCGGTEQASGYGIAFGPMGSYTMCTGCDALLEFHPDLQGVPEDRIPAIQAEVEKWRREVWGESP